MSFSSVASQLYNIKSRKNVSFSTAFGLMVREELAARTSVFNLVKIATGSTLLATILQSKYGKRTPLEREEDKERNKQAEQDKRFKMFTVSSIANLSKRISLTEEITKRNTAMILNLYNDIGYSRIRKRMSPVNIKNLSSVRVPISSKTVVGEIDQLKKQIEQLDKLKKVKPKPQTATEKKKKEKSTESIDPSGLLNLLLTGGNLKKLLSIVAPGVAVILGGGAAAIGINALSRSTQRLMGRKDIEGDNEISRKIDPYLSSLAAGGLGYAALGAAKIVKGGINLYTGSRAAKTTAPPTPTAPPTQILDKNGKPLRGAALKSAQKKASEATIPVDQLIRIEDITQQNTRFAKFARVVLQAAKYLAPLKLAGVVYDLSTMSSAMADYANKKINFEQYKEIMSQRYGAIVQSIGIYAVSAGIGAAIGFAAGGGLGAIPGIGIGLAVGGIAELSIGEESYKESIGTFIFETIHEEKTAPQIVPRGRQPVNATERRQTGATTPVNQYNSTQTSGPGRPAVTEVPMDISGVGAEGVAELAAAAIGLSEQDPALKKFLAQGGVTVNDPQFEAWCASFVNSVLNRKGFIGTGSKVANSFQNWGVRVNSFAQVKPGDVIIETSNKPVTSTGGHVGIATGVFDSASGKIEIIAGNYQNKVSRYFIPADGDVMIRRASSAVMAIASPTPLNQADVSTATLTKPSTRADVSTTTAASTTPSYVAAADTASVSAPPVANMGESRQQSSEEEAAAMLASNVENTAIDAHAAIIAARQLASASVALQAGINETRTLAMDNEFPSVLNPQHHLFSRYHQMTKLV